MIALDALGAHEVLLKLSPDSEPRLVPRHVGRVVTDRETLIIGATRSFEETPVRFLVLVPGSEANHLGDRDVSPSG